MTKDFKELEVQYLTTWKLADKEKKECGKISKATERKLIALEKKLNA